MLQVEVYDKRIAAVKEEEDGLHKDINTLLASRLQLESFQNEKYAPVIADLNERIHKEENKLQALRERRMEIKMSVEHCNHFTDEGATSIPFAHYISWWCSDLLILYHFAWVITAQESTLVTCRTTAEGLCACAGSLWAPSSWWSTPSRT